MLFQDLFSALRSSAFIRGRLFLVVERHISGHAHDAAALMQGLPLYQTAVTLAPAEMSGYSFSRAKGTSELGVIAFVLSPRSAAIA